VTHEEKVARVVSQVRARAAGARLTIQKRHPGHTPHELAYKRGRHPVDVDALDQVLSVDREARTATVEGQVTLGQLCKCTFPQSLMPKVVPEFETFTVSGLVNGLGIETSSHRHGVFPASLVELEVVLGDGSVVIANREKNADLLTHLPGSYGTLGIVTRATLALSEAKPFVRSRYRRFSQRKEYCAAFADALNAHEFVEGFVLAPDEYILCAGNYSDRAALDVFDAAEPGNPWYYQHAAKQAALGAEDLVPSYQYMFRHQRSLLWVAGIVADLKFFSTTRWGRAYLDREVERKVRATGFRGNMPIDMVERCMINQDMGIALERLDEGIAWVQKNLDVHPLWNCPCGPGALDLAFATPARLRGKRGMLVDLGIYGEPKVRNYRNFDAMRALQKFVDVPSMWGVSYLRPDELREIYDFASYEKVQQSYKATDAFVPLAEKICFMPESSKQDRVPLWRLVNLYYDLRARFISRD
jgi:delta24-sterol reductase